MVKRLDGYRLLPPEVSRYLDPSCLRTCCAERQRWMAVTSTEICSCKHLVRLTLCLRVEEGSIPFKSAKVCPCSPTGRGTGFRFRVVGVRISPGAPTIYYEPIWSNWQRRRFQTPNVVGSSPTMGTKCCLSVIGEHPALWTPEFRFNSWRQFQCINRS